MKEIGAFAAKNKLAELLDLAENGEEIIIASHGPADCALLHFRL
jgi:prevent-host-death family protein